MSIQLPLKIEKSEGAKFCHSTDSTGRAIRGGLIRGDADEIVNALNSQPKRKSKKIQIEEALRRSDLTARLAEREDIEWGHFDSLPRGEHVARMKR